MAFFADLGRFPEACRRGRWAESGYETTCYVLQHVRGQQLFHPSVLPRHVDRRSSRLLPHYRVREFVEGGGGLNCEAKAQVFVVTPPPPFFLKVGRKGGGVTAGQYGSNIYAGSAAYASLRSAITCSLPFMTQFCDSLCIHDNYGHTTPLSIPTCMYITFITQYANHERHTPACQRNCMNTHRNNHTIKVQGIRNDDQSLSPVIPLVS